VVRLMTQPSSPKISTRSSGGPTIIDVAREAGVSYTTVSRVINNKHNVRSDKRERVLSAMQRLGYVVNQHARMLAGGRSQMIGLLVQDLGTAYISEIVRGIETALGTTSYDLLLYTTHRRPFRESSYLMQMSSGIVDGLLLVSPYQESLPIVHQRDIPHVIIDYGDDFQQSASVSATNWQGAYEATSYLIGLGHRRIACVTGLAGVSSSDRRVEGYCAALKAAGIALDPELICAGDFNFQGGVQAANQLLTLPQLPTAVFACNDVSALGVIDTFKANQIRIPKDVSVIGFDDIPSSAYAHPSLTTIRQPLFEIGRTAMSLLLSLLAGEHVSTRQIELATTLVVRESCHPPLQ
jgi:LacI family transcriptional regulator